MLADRHILGNDGADDPGLAGGHHHGRVLTLFRSLAALLAVLVAAILYLALTPLAPPRVGFATPAWIGPVQVVDAVAETVLADRAIRVEAGRIAAVVPVAELTDAERAALHRPGGSHVISGLWDMHALSIRYAPALDYPLHLAHGVTRLRNILNCAAEGSFELFPCQSDKRAWNAAVADGTLAGPVIMESGSFPLNGPGRRPSAMPEVFDAATPEQVQALVGLIAADPFRPEHLKAYDHLPRDSYFALVEEGLRHGLRTNGHVPVSVRVEEAVAAGHQAIAHARVLPIGCSGREDEIMALRTARAPRLDWMRLAIDTYDPAVCANLWARMAAAGTFISPTLVTRWNETRAGIEAFRADPDVGRFTPLFIDLIQWEDIAAIEGRDAGTEEVYARYYEAAAARTAEADRAGVRLLLGTDHYDLLVVPGLGMHHEIALWRAAGIPNAAILRALTVNAAAYAGREADMGRVAPGHVADLVFTDGDPLADPSVLRRPAAVMLEGRLYDRESLDRMLDHAEAVAGGPRLTIHFLRDLARNPSEFVR